MASELTGDADLPVLRVRLDTAGPVAAGEAGELLEGVARGFDRCMRQKRRRELRLGVRRLDSGSLIVDLIVISPDGPTPPDDALWAVSAYVDFVAGLLAVAEGSRPGILSGPDARLIELLLGPIIRSTATSVDLGLGGQEAKVRMDVDTVDRIRSNREADAQERSQRAALPAPPADARRPAQLKGSHGTVFDVKGRLYVQLEGEEGVLNPLLLRTGVTVEDGGVYSFDGAWSGRNYLIASAVRIA